MGVVVVTGAMLQCSFGSTPANLNVTSQNKVLVEGKPVATIKDTGAIINITSCGMCSSLANPQVAAATAAALGVLTPQPCIPSTTGCWIASQTKCIASGVPVLTNDSRLICAYGGVISIVNPGSGKVMI